MAEFYTVITTAGREAVARATQAGVKVDITHMAIGDGGGVPVTPSENQTQLVNECWRGLVATYSQQGSKLIIDSYIPPEEASFITREMGLFTADGVLFAVCKTPEMRKVLPSEGAIDSFVFGMELDITDVDMRYIEIHTNPIFNFDPAGSAEAVQQNLDIHIANKQNPHNTTAAHVGAIPTAQKGAVNGVATLDSNKQLTSTQIPSSITKHIANKQNPHGVTAAQVGAYTKTETNNLINAGKVPTGSILWFATNNAPSGFLACNGANISRTTYAGLFSIIGVAFGAGDGSTTFALPNLINKFIKGSNTVGAKNDGTFLTLLPNRTTGQNVIANTMVNNAISSSSTTYTTNNTSTYNEGDNISATKYYIQPPNITLKAFIKY